MAKKKKKGKPGWRVNGHNVYHVKGAKPSRRKTYKTKKSAQRAARKRR